MPRGYILANNDDSNNNNNNNSNWDKLPKPRIVIYNHDTKCYSEIKNVVNADDDFISRYLTKYTRRHYIHKTKWRRKIYGGFITTKDSLYYIPTITLIPDLCLHYARYYYVTLLKESLRAIQIAEYHGWWHNQRWNNANNIFVPFIYDTVQSFLDNALRIYSNELAGNYRIILYNDNVRYLFKNIVELSIFFEMVMNIIKNEGEYYNEKKINRFLCDTPINLKKCIVDTECLHVSMLPGEVSNERFYQVLTKSESVPCQRVFFYFEFNDLNFTHAHWQIQYYINGTVDVWFRDNDDNGGSSGDSSAKFFSKKLDKRLPDALFFKIFNQCQIRCFSAYSSFSNTHNQRHQLINCVKGLTIPFDGSIPYLERRSPVVRYESYCFYSPLTVASHIFFKSDDNQLKTYYSILYALSKKNQEWIREFILHYHFLTERKVNKCNKEYNKKKVFFKIMVETLNSKKIFWAFF